LEISLLIAFKSLIIKETSGKNFLRLRLYGRYFTPPSLENVSLQVIFTGWERAVILTATARRLDAFPPIRAASPHLSPRFSGFAENHWFFSAFPVKPCLQVA
jgi:hypothetical protein